MSLKNQTTTALCQLLETGDEADRCYAARALGTIRDTSAVTALTERLRDEDLDVCIDAADALGRIGATEAVPALIESLENDPNGEVCTAVAIALGRIGGEQAIAALRRVAVERPEGIEWDGDWDTWWDVQLAAVKALGAFGDTASADLLIGILEDETQQDIESELLHALALMPGRGSDYLIQRMHDQGQRPQARWRAAKALGYATATDEIVKALGRALKDPHPEVRVEAIQALARLHAERYLSALALLLRDPEAKVREAALKAITGLAGTAIDDSGLQQALLALLDDPDSQVRATLFQILAHTVEHHPLTPEMLDKILANLNDPAAETAMAACRLLAGNGDRRAIGPLLELLEQRNGHPMVRREAALVLGRLGSADAATLQALTRAVGDSQQPVRLAALNALMMLENSLPEQDGGAALESHSQETAPERPLEIIIAAVNGRIEVADGTPAATTAGRGDTGGPDAPAADGRTGRDLLMRNPEPAPDAIAQPEEEAAEPELTLPESPARIVREGEVKSATSTLDAIAMDNVEMVLEPPAPTQPEMPDAETLEYLEVVEENKEMMRRIRSNRSISAEQDVRRLGARILADSDRSEAVRALIQALSDDDELLRREAAEAIGELARKKTERSELMDAVGILVTQLAVGEPEQRLICARSLGYLGNQAAVVPLLEALNDSEANVRIQACRALGQLLREGADPAAADHMVVRPTPPLSIARKLLERLEDAESGVRLAAARELARILQQLEERTFTDKAVEQIIDSVFQWSGEEARLMGGALRGFDTGLVTEKLLARLERAEHSSQRSVIIEMLEELLDPSRRPAERAA